MQDPTTTSLVASTGANRAIFCYKLSGSETNAITGLFITVVSTWTYAEQHLHLSTDPSKLFFNLTHHSSTLVSLAHKVLIPMARYI